MPDECKIFRQKLADVFKPTEEIVLRVMLPRLIDIYLYGNFHGSTGVFDLVPNLNFLRKPGGDFTWMADFSRLDVVLISQTWPTELRFQITN